MNKPRIILAAIGIFAAIGGALAFNVRATSGFIFPEDGVTVPTNTALNCPRIAYGCTVLYQGSEYQLYTLDGTVYHEVAKAL